MKDNDLIWDLNARHKTTLSSLIHLLAVPFFLFKNYFSSKVIEKNNPTLS